MVAGPHIWRRHRSRACPRRPGGGPWRRRDGRRLISRSCRPSTPGRAGCRAGGGCRGDGDAVADLGLGGHEYVTAGPWPTVGSTGGVGADDRAGPHRGLALQHHPGSSSTSGRAVTFWRRRRCAAGRSSHAVAHPVAVDPRPQRLLGLGQLDLVVTPLASATSGDSMAMTLWPACRRTAMASVGSTRPGRSRATVGAAPAQETPTEQ